MHGCTGSQTCILQLCQQTCTRGRFPIGVLPEGSQALASQGVASPPAGPTGVQPASLSTRTDFRDCAGSEGTSIAGASRPALDQGRLGHVCAESHSHSRAGAHRACVMDWQTPWGWRNQLPRFLEVTVKLRLISFSFGTSALLVLALGAAGCARRAVEEPPAAPAPPPTATSAPIETAPPIVEAPPPVTTPPDIRPAFFDLDSYRLSESARQALDRAAKILREQPDMKVTIEGHCDERGTTDYNMALGEQRARVARDYLLAAGIASERMQIISYGEERPFDAGHNEAAWAENRQAHFVVRQSMLSGSPAASPASR